MADNVERLGAIIEVQYQGEQAVQRYLADLERLGALSAQQATDFRRVWSGAASGVLETRDAVAQLNAILGQTGRVSAQMLQRFDWAVEGNRRVRTLEQSLQSLQATIGKLASGQPQVGSVLPAYAALQSQNQSQARQQLAQVASTQLGTNQRQIASFDPRQVAEQRALISTTAQSAQSSDRLTRAVEASTSVSSQTKTALDELNAQLAATKAAVDAARTTTPGVALAAPAVAAGAIAGQLGSPLLNAIPPSVIADFQRLTSQYQAAQAAVTAGPRAIPPPPPPPIAPPYVNPPFLINPALTGRSGGELVPYGRGFTYGTPPPPPPPPPPSYPPPYANPPFYTNPAYTGRTGYFPATYNRGFSGGPPPTSYPPRPQSGSGQYYDISGMAGGSGYRGGAGGFGGPPPPVDGGRGGSYFGGTGAGFGQDFAAGFKGTSNLASTLGQTAKFSLFYGAMYKTLFAITQTFGAALNESIAFDNALVELRIASGQSVESVKELGTKLGGIASQAGFSPAEGIIAGARAIGLYGATDSSKLTQDTVALESARTTSQIALGSGRSFQDIQGDVAATSTAFGLGAGGQQFLADLDAYLSRKSGIEAGSTFQPVAQTAALGQAAGFGLQEQVAISADLQARTGQSASTIGGLLSQLFTRTGEGALTNVAAKYGIDPTLSLRDTMKELSSVYKNASQRDKIEIAASFGRGRSQGASAILLTDFNKIQGRARQAGTDSLGASEKSYQERLATIGGVIQQLKGDFVNFAVALGHSGLVEVIGGLAKVLGSFLQSTTALLQIWDQFPGVLKGVLASLALLAITQRTVGLGGAVQFAGGIGSGLIAGRNPLGAPKLPGPAGTGAAIGGALSSLVPLAVIAAGVVAAGSIISSVQKARDLRYEIAGSNAQFARENPDVQAITANALHGHAATLTSEATNLRHSTNSFANALTFGQLNNAPQREADNLDRQAAFYQRQANRQASIDAANAAQGNTAVLGFDPDSINAAFKTVSDAGGSAADQLQVLIKALRHVGQAGYDAAGAFTVPQIATAGANIGGAIQAGLTDKHGGERQFDLKTFFYHGPFRDNSHDDTLANIQNIGPVRQGELLQAQYKRFDVTSARDLRHPKVLQGVAAGLLDDYTNEGSADNIIRPGLTEEGRAAAVDVVRKAILRALRRQANSGKRGPSGNALLSNAEATASSSAIFDNVSSRLDFETQTSQHGRREAIIHNAIKQIRTKVVGKSQTPEELDRTGQQIQALKDQYSNEQFLELEELRRVAQRNATNATGRAKAGQRFLRRELGAAIRTGNQDLMVQILEAAGKGAIAIADQLIKQALRVVRAAQREADAMVAAANSQRDKVAGTLDRLAGGSGDRPDYTGQGELSPEDQQKADRARHLRNAVKRSLSTTDRNSLYGGHPSDIGLDYPAAGTDPAAAAAADKDTPAQIAAARYAASVANNSTLSAKAAIQTAKADLDAQKKGTVAYYQALGAYNQAKQAYTDTLSSVSAAYASAYAAHDGGAIAAAKAQITAASRSLATTARGTVENAQALQSFYEGQSALADAMRQYQANLDTLSIDATNPLLVAGVAAHAAARKLAQDRAAGRGSDVIAQDRVDLISAQNEQESTRFQQRLDAATTADNLGRISHQAYIRYLDHEHNRLEAIKHRTFQQQQELDQVDGLIKDAQDALQGQFNLGDIKLPTPYEVRRFIEEQSGAHGRRAKATRDELQRANDDRTARTGAGTTITHHQSVSISIDGADVGQIKRVLTDLLGPQAARRSSLTRRKA